MGKDFAFVRINGVEFGFNRNAEACTIVGDSGVCSSGGVFFVTLTVDCERGFGIAAVGFVVVIAAGCEGE